MYLDLHTVYCSILGRGSIVIYVRTGFFLIVEVSNLVKSLLAWPLKYAFNDFGFQVFLQMDSKCPKEFLFI